MTIPEQGARHSPRSKVDLEVGAAMESWSFIYMELELHLHGDGEKRGEK